MLQRVFARENVDERRRALFRSSGITTHRQLLQRPLWDVAHAVDMSVRETERGGDTVTLLSACRLLQITIARIKLTQAGQEADINELAAAVIKRIRVVKVNSIAAFASKFKEMKAAMHSLKIKLLIIDCVTTLFMKFIMERHSLHHAITIVKSSVAGYVVQPFTVKEGGVEAIESSRQADFHEFAIHDDLLSDLAMATLPMVVPACTLRSTQQSNAEDPDATQLISQSDDLASQSQQDQAQETESSSFDIVSDSNSEEEHESFHWGAVTEE
ncbi:hypothetical protein JG687_00006640 [Phytophthora cactorum]|uniref:Uncharacterized protein n=1 Tax=Phytophthora cactorum TaxID=29920 RepID=A0A8T1UKH3_9STRA|nr:hypothetical protein JG687_00006640 [Phytophthora cactorum]